MEGRGQGARQKAGGVEEEVRDATKIIHVMWDDTAYGDIGIPAIQKVRGLKTPRLNTMGKAA